MSNLFAFLGSSIGRKIVMGLTGLALIGFLVTHLGGNLLLFYDEGDAKGQTFNEYSDTLTSNKLLIVAEVGLLGVFLAHLGVAFGLTRKNSRARPVGYAVDRPAGHTSRKSLASTWMIISGVVVLIFVPVHIWGFKYAGHADSEETVDLYTLVVQTFMKPGWVFFYCLVMAIIGVHLWHGFGSAFESLGLPYRNIVRRSGQALAVIIAGGFFLIPLILFFSSRGGG